MPDSLEISCILVQFMPRTGLLDCPPEAILGEVQAVECKAKQLRLQASDSTHALSASEPAGSCALILIQVFIQILKLLASVPDHPYQHRLRRVPVSWKILKNNSQ